LLNIQSMVNLIKFDLINLSFFILIYFELYVISTIIKRASQSKEDRFALSHSDRIYIRLTLIAFAVVIFYMFFLFAKINCNNKGQWPIVYLSYPIWFSIAVFIANIYGIYEEDP